MFKNIQSPFKGLDTEWQRLKIFRSTGALISPEAIVVGADTRFRIKNTNKTFDCEEATIQYIPIYLVLKRFLELPSVLSQIKLYAEFLSYQDSIDVVSNFIQGDLWGKIKNVTDGKFILPLFIYTDDFETNNCLGSHAGSGGKLTGVYGEIALMPPELKTKLDTMFLIQIFQSVDKKIFGNKAIFQRLIDDLKDLSENGIEVETTEGSEMVYFELGLFLGDNLAMHELLGFVTSFVATHPCRFCEITKPLLRTTASEIPGLIRTKKSYDNAVELISGNQHVRGIISKCIWHDLPNFHAIENLSVDFMHDFIEGICKIELINVVQLLISLKLISDETINNRINAFYFGETCKQNKPPDISPDCIKNSNLKLSAGGCLCFMQHLGLFIGDLIPENNDVWQIYTSLNEIVYILSEKVHHRSTYELVGTLITEHLELYKKVVKKPFINKQHHALHYRRVLNLVGPVSNTSCMRV